MAECRRDAALSEEELRDVSALRDGFPHDFASRPGTLHYQIDNTDHTHTAVAIIDIIAAVCVSPPPRIPR